jgi:hypothetical protein
MVRETKQFHNLKSIKTIIEMHCISPLITEMTAKTYWESLYTTHTGTGM